VKNNKINKNILIEEINLDNNKDKNEEEKIKNKSYIIAEINIEEKDINKKIRIINSFEEYKRNNNFISIKEEDYYKYNNEKEIKENCEIKINNKRVEFCYFFESKEKGKFTIEYIFSKNLINTDYMFCESNL